ncbi:MAG TPA: BACON domain-containing carbohydrate-binding protein [Blastocatellia bacterium]|nr:BACON domain-containing carbohydrate-binding protein [Blastocatellia bacterium]
MVKKTILITFIGLLGLAVCPDWFSSPPAAQTLPPINYDIVYVRSPRPGNNSNTFWSDAITPLFLDPGADLVLLHPNGSEEVLFDGGPDGSVMDPYVSYDARSVVFTYFPNVRNVNTQRGLNNTYALSFDGADIYRVDLVTRVVTRLTFQEFTPNTGNGANFDCSQSQTNCPRVGVFNTGPAFLPDGRIVFTSTRDNFVPNKMTNGGQRAMQLYVMDGDGKNVEPIGFLNVSSAMHPFVLKDGRIAFTSWENMGARDDRVFPLWAIWPDGTRFEPFSGFGDGPFAHHFMTQMSDGSIVVCRYYNLNNNGFGELYRFPIDGTGKPDEPLFQPIPPDTNSPDEIPLKRVGYTRITPFTTGDDFPSPCRVGDPPFPVVACQGGNNTRVGKFTLPSAAPNNELLVVYTRGSANHNGIYVGAGFAAPYYDGGIYRMRGDQVLGRPEDLVLVKNDPNFNEMWPRAVVPYQQIYGVASPPILPELTNEGAIDSRLPEGTPLALMGTSSMISRDTRPFRGDRFYQHENFGDRNWTRQGADAGLYNDDDIYAVRILALQPITDRSYPNNGRAFESHFSERVRILGEIPVRKEGVIDAQGNVDTSFLAKIPADVPFTFQTLDRNGLVLNTAQTWHQARPGERRVDCGGCHAHSRPALDFSTTAAAQPSYVVRDLAQTTPLLAVDGSQAPGVTTNNVRSMTVEYLRDIRPILQAKCASCHTSRNGQTPAAGLDLDADDRLIEGGYPATYSLLARSPSAANPSPRSVTPGGDWYWPQVTRYIRAGQSRQSLLVWKIFGQRLDGRLNSHRPTETAPGNPATIPPGAQWQDCDLDYTGTQMPPPASGATLTWDERMKIARWVDLGAPIDLSGIFGNGFAGFLEDDIRPTLSLVPTVKRAAVAGSLSRFVIGAYDMESGLNPATLSLTLNRAVGPFPAGANLAAGVTITEGGTVTINLPAALQLASGDVRATLQIRDMAGHTTRIVRTYKANPTICGSLSSTGQFFAVAGGTGSIVVTAPGSCSWSATSNADWIVITSSSGGTGNDTVSFEVRENLIASARSATMLIAGRTVTVIQDGGIGDNCLYTVAPTSLAFSRGGGSSSLTVSCEQRCAWQATSNVGWITITSSGMGIGNGAVSISVAANTTASGRAGIITVGGKAIKVKQK